MTIIEAGVVADPEEGDAAEDAEGVVVVDVVVEDPFEGGGM